MPLKALSHLQTPLEKTQAMGFFHSLNEVFPFAIPMFSGAAQRGVCWNTFEVAAGEAQNLGWGFMPALENCHRHPPSLSALDPCGAHEPFC